MKSLNFKIKERSNKRFVNMELHYFVLCSFGYDDILGYFDPLEDTEYILLSVIRKQFYLLSESIFVAQGDVLHN